MPCPCRTPRRCRRLREFCRVSCRDRRLGFDWLGRIEKEAANGRQGEDEAAQRKRRIPTEPARECAKDVRRNARAEIAPHIPPTESGANSPSADILGE